MDQRCDVTGGDSPQNSHKSRLTNQASTILWEWSKRLWEWVFHCKERTRYASITCYENILMAGLGKVSEALARDALGITWVDTHQSSFPWCKYPNGHACAMYLQLSRSFLTYN